MKRFLSIILTCQTGIHNFGNIFRGNNIEWRHRPLINIDFFLRESFSHIEAHMVFDLDLSIFHKISYIAMIPRLTL